MPRPLFAFFKRTENSAPGSAHFVQAFFALCRRLCYNKAYELLQKPGAFIMMLENYHTHTHRCHHAVGEDRAYVEAAIQAGSAADGFFLTDNLGLYQFWLAIPPYGEQVYFLPEVGDYVLAQAEGPLLQLFAAFGPAKLDLSRLAASFGPAVQEVSLGFTPACREGFAVKDYREEDCTLFVLGKELETLLQTPLRFPLLSHA